MVKRVGSGVLLLAIAGCATGRPTDHDPAVPSETALTALRKVPSQPFAGTGLLATDRDITFDYLGVLEPGTLPGEGAAAIFQQLQPVPQPLGFSAYRLVWLRTDGDVADLLGRLTGRSLDWGPLSDDYGRLLARRTR